MSSDMSHEVTAPQVDYKVRHITPAKYKYVKIPLNNLGTSTFSLAPSGSQLCEWKLPAARPYNLARSYVTYSITCPALALNSNVTWEDTFDLGQRVTFGQAGGIDLVDLSYAGNYVKVCRKIDTPFDEYVTGTDDLNQLHPGQLASAVNRVPGGYNKKAALTTVAPTDNYLECKYLSTAAVNTATISYRRVPLSCFTGTLLAVDKDFYTNTEMYFRVLAGTGSKMAFATTSASAAAPTNANSATIASITVADIYLYLAVEQNPDIIAGLVNQYNSGSLIYRNIPFTQSFRNVGSVKGSQTNITLQLSQQYGRRLKRIVHSIFHPTESLNTAYDHENYDGAKITSYQTHLDSLPLQDRILSCLRPAAGVLNMDDWLENKKYCQGKSVILSAENYGINWFHIDSFTEPRSTDTLPTENIDEGLSMDVSRTWQFSCLNTNDVVSSDNLIHYTFAQFTRDIVVRPDGMGATWLMQ